MKSKQTSDGKFTTQTPDISPSQVSSSDNELHAAHAQFCIKIHSTINIRSFQFLAAWPAEPPSRPFIVLGSS